MRLIYAYEFDAADINTQSGRPFSILQQLERHACKVVRVFPLRQQVRYLYSGKYLYYRTRGRIYRPDREPMLLRSFARQIERRVRGVVADVLFAPGSHSVAALDVPYPKIFCADAPFANVLEFYDSFANCAPEFIEQGHEQERKALANCAAAIYPSEWAARGAIEHYGASPERVHIIPFGANIAAPDAVTINNRIAARRFDEVRILFVGRDWYRKGGDTVLGACDVLGRRKVTVRLDIVGLCHVPVALPQYARSHGLLDKNDPDQRRRFEDLLGRAHFLFVPSRAENYGMIFCEAAALGVPAVATEVGGIPTIIRHGETGFTLPLTSSPEAFADVLQGAIADPKRYRELALATAADHRTRLNWEVFGKEFLKIIRRTVG
jgi:glycosyltransferase involved in cell wall biosynthesis